MSCSCARNPCAWGCMKSTRASEKFSYFVQVLAAECNRLLSWACPAGVPKSHTWNLRETASTALLICLYTTSHPPPPFPDSLHQGTIVWHENHMAQAQQQAEQLMLAATGGRGGGWGRVCCSALSVFLKLRLPGRGRLSEILEPGPSRSRFGSSRDLRDVSLSLAFCFRFRGYPSTQKSREPCLTDRGVNRTGSRRNAKP